MLIGNSEAASVFFQPAHGAGCGVQSEGAAPGQHDAVDLLHHVAGIEQIGLSCRRTAAAHIHAGAGALWAEDDGAAGAMQRVCRLADLYAVYC